MSDNEQIKELFMKRKQEASWCYSCARRIVCGDKEAVAMEEHLAYCNTLKYVNVKAECLGYIKDSSVKVDPRVKYFGELFS